MSGNNMTDEIETANAEADQSSVDNNNLSVEDFAMRRIGQLTPEAKEPKEEEAGETEEQETEEVTEEETEESVETEGEERMRLRQPTPQRESAKRRRSQMIPDPEFGQTLARKRTPRSQGELRRQDQGPRDQPMMRLTIEAEETTSMTVA